MTDISNAVEYWKQGEAAIEGKDLDYTMKPKAKVRSPNSMA